ncbi:DUF933 domain-containing protein [Negativibacillus massiliensis]
MATLFFSVSMFNLFLSEKDLVPSEGKEYVMQDGDVVLFRFNV